MRVPIQDGISAFIPLGWLSWDEASEDKLYVIPLPLPIVSFKAESGDSEYLVVFPFYGKQRVQKSVKYAYLLSAFWYEYDDDEKLTEYTVLWPFFNRYSSPKRSGWRFFPLIWHSETTREGTHTSKYVSPLHYSHYKTDEKGNIELYKFVLNPLWHSKKSVTGNAVHERHFFPALPVIYGHLRTEISYSYDGWDRDSEGGAVKGHRLSPNLAAYEMSDWKWVVPLAFWSSGTRVTLGGDKTDDFTLLGLPLPLLQQHPVPGARPEGHWHRDRFRVRNRTRNRHRHRWETG